MPEVDLNELAELIVEAKRNTFAAGKEEETPEGSKISRFQKGRYSYSDIWDGSTPFQGKELVRDIETKNPVWGMVYRGRDINVRIDNVIFVAFLRKSLMQVTKEIPYRGPEFFFNVCYPGFRYENVAKGDLTEFRGNDRVLYDGRVVFKSGYMGGLLEK
jgi:hypothetical protein